MACSPNFSIGSQPSSPYPKGTGPFWTVNIQTEVFEQFFPFFCMGCTISFDVVNRFGVNRRCSFKLDKPTTFISNRFCISASSTNCLTRIIANYCNFAITCVEINRIYSSNFLNQVSNKFLGLLFILHYRWMRPQYNTSLNLLSYFSN